MWTREIQVIQNLVVYSYGNGNLLVDLPTFIVILNQVSLSIIYNVTKYFPVIRTQKSEL